MLQTRHIFPPGFRRNTGRVRVADLDGPCDLVASVTETSLAAPSGVVGRSTAERTKLCTRKRHGARRVRVQCLRPTFGRSLACFFQHDQSPSVLRGGTRIILFRTAFTQIEACTLHPRWELRVRSRASECRDRSEAATATSHPTRSPDRTQKTHTNDNKGPPPAYMCNAD